MTANHLGLGPCKNFTSWASIDMREVRGSATELHGTDLFSNCTEECKALGHSDRCWMPAFVAGDGRQGTGGDYRSNLHVPGMDSVPNTEVPATAASGHHDNDLTLTSDLTTSDRSFSTFGKDGGGCTTLPRSMHHLHHHLHQSHQLHLQHNSPATATATTTTDTTLERKDYESLRAHKRIC
ncbi:protocadherin-11 X-linked [Salvelinus sp. IW2-2015]|uniref:protocadherin-11 X-linked n=1 Tax=Salvelinus sp. IW2-2015 TaxID=2691554 RepID=UPI0038D4D176